MSEPIEPAAGSGTFFTHPDVLKIIEGTDAVPPPCGEDRHMSRIEAVAILMRLARSRGRTVEEVTALQMGASRLVTRHFQNQRNWARRRDAEKAEKANAGTPGADAPNADASPHEPEGEGK